MTKKRRLPGAGERVKVGRRLITLPGVQAMTKSTKPGDGELERPTEELTEELSRTVKAAYQ